MQEQLDRMEAKLSEISGQLNLLLGNAGKEAPAVAVDTTTGEILDNANWPAWFSLGHGMKGWKVSLAVAEKWRVGSSLSEEYCLDKIYVVRSQWTEAHEKKGGNPYARFQRACRENWGGTGVASVQNSDEQEKHRQERAAYDFEGAAAARKAAGEHERELREAEERQ